MMPAAPSKRAQPPRAYLYWYGAILLGGLGFGLLGERRPFGGDIFAHPFVLFVIAGIAGLLVVRAVLGRPVPEVIPERVLMLGCFIGIAAFLAGNWIAAHVIGG